MITLEVKQNNRTLFIPSKSLGAYNLVFDSQNGNRITTGRESWASVCINCHKPKCIYFTSDEIKCDRFDISQSSITTVCPLDAISEGKECVTINNEKCVGCGICASRCPFGAISVKGKKAVVSVADSKTTPSYPETKENIEQQQAWIESSRIINKSGQICKDSFLEGLLIEKGKDNKIRIHKAFRDNLIQRNLVLSLLIQHGYKAQLPRIGNNSERMDCLFQADDYNGVIEIEIGEDTLDVPRNLLDDVAMLHYRYHIAKETIIPLHICFKLQNRRSEYWRIINDVSRICNININTISIGALFLLMWNFVQLKDIKHYYFDTDILSTKESTIRSIVEDTLGRSLQLDNDTSVFFESEK